MNVQETKYTIKNLPPRESVLVQGPHGCAKSEVIRQIAMEMSEEEGVPYELIDLRLSQKEVGDIVGMPRTLDTYTAQRKVYDNGKESYKEVVQKDVTVFNLPAWYPTDPDSHGILFLDELNRATREVQQAAFELVLDYRLNFKDLPKGWRVVSAINDDTDTYSVLELDPALQDRFYVIDFRPTTEEWLTFAKDNKVQVHDAVIQFITKFDEHLDVPEKCEPGKVYPSRRSWVKLSKAIKNFEFKNEDILQSEQANYLVKLAGGYVGATVAVHFEDFIRKQYKVLTAKEILENYSPEMSKELSKMNVAELAYYNKLILEFFKKDLFKEKHYNNLYKYFKALPKEAAADCWNGIIRESKDLAVLWWNSNANIPKYISGLLQKNKDNSLE